VPFYYHLTFIALCVIADNRCCFALFIAEGSLKVGLTVSAAGSNQAKDANTGSELSDDDDDDGGNEMSEELNSNSNNGNEFADDDLPLPTICVYGSSGMAGPLDLDIGQTISDLPDDSYRECNVSTFDAFCSS